MPPSYATHDSWICETWLNRVLTLKIMMRYLCAQHTATHCNALQHTATHCSTLQHAANTDAIPLCSTHCNTLQHTATHCNTLNTLQHTAAHCNTLQHTATHCNTLHHTANNDAIPPFARPCPIICATRPIHMSKMAHWYVYDTAGQLGRGLFAMSDLLPRDVSSRA